MELTEAEIKSILKSGEGYNAEFKIRVPSKVRELAGEICAFANAAGGVVLLGISDDNKIVGIEIDNRKRSSIQDAINQISPLISCPFYFVEVNGKQIGVIEVPSGNHRPYALSGAIYVRQGSNSQKVTSIEKMRDFFQESNRIFFDEVGCKNFTYKKDLDKNLFKEFRAIAGFSSTTSNLQIIKNLKLLNEDGHFKNGSVLFFGKKPDLFFDNADIRCVAFEGTDKFQIIDDKVWGGALIHQYEQAMQWLKSKLDVRYEIEGGGPRIEKMEIPEVALKEAIINALAHRDYYDKGSRIMVELFTDRLEITNPGGLISTISPKEFGIKSHSRNLLLFGLFQRINMVEQVGSGINRIKISLKEAKLPKPIFRTKGLFTIVLSRPKNRALIRAVIRAGIGNKEIINGILSNNKITISELAELTKASTRYVSKIIADLREVGVLERVGGTRGHWKFKEVDADRIVEILKIRNDEEAKTKDVSNHTPEEMSGKMSVKMSGEMSGKILELISANSKITIPEMAKILGVTNRTIERNLQKLQKSNRLKRVGPKKGGFWQIIDKKKK